MNISREYQQEEMFPLNELQADDSGLNVVQWKERDCLYRVTPESPEFARKLYEGLLKNPDAHDVTWFFNL